MAWSDKEKNNEQLIRKIIGCSSKMPISLLYLELGLLPIEFIIKSRRLCFLKYLLDQEESSLLQKVFQEQNKNIKQGDWLHHIKKDLKHFNITMNFEEIQQMSENSFKKIV